MRQPKWMLDVRVGDVIARQNGSWRIVREVSRKSEGRLRCVTLAIRRCSWTNRAYTVLNDNDLRQCGYRRVARNAKMHTRLDHLIAKAIHQPCSEPICLRCHEVKGIS